LARSSESKPAVVGHALQGALTGAAIGALTGTGSALAPEGLSPKALGIGAIAALGIAAWQQDSVFGRVAANANVALSALAVHEYFGNKVAAAAGTQTQVLTNKAKHIAAHGDMAGEVGMGADPLVEWGSRKFAAAH
jgi:hypothetical protein